MPKQIRVSDEVFQHLLLLQRPREPLGGIIGRLLFIYDLIMKAAPVIEGQHEYLKWKRAEQEKAHPVD